MTGPLFWLHGDESKERLEMYLEKVAESGNGCFTAESRPHRDWLGEGWYRDLDICLQAARKHNMKMWIFDEKWWPSQGVGGKVPARYAAKRLAADAVAVEGPAPFHAEGHSGERYIATLAGKLDAGGKIVGDSINLAYEQEFAPDWAFYADFTYAEGDHLTRFLNYNRSGPVAPVTGNSYTYTGKPWALQLDEVMVTNSRGNSEYKGLTLGIRKRFSNGYQLEGNYVLSKDEDDDSNERDPFTDRSFNFFDLSQDWGYSDRDIRNKFNFFGFFDLTRGFALNTRVQYRGAQPITANPRVLNGEDRGRNNERKDNEFFTFDWRLSWSWRLGGDWQIMPILEMFNTFNNDNNINPLSTPALSNFDGYLRTGVGDPRQLQLAVKVTF